MTHDPSKSSLTPPAEGPPPSPPDHGHADPPRSLGELIWSTSQLLICVAATTAFLVWLMVTPAGGHGDDDGPKSPPEVVQPDGPLRVRIDTEIGKKLLDRLQTTTVL